MSDKRLIVGLGNPGKGYELTRHNLGFRVVQKLAENVRLKFGMSSFTNGLAAEGRYEEHELCLLMPLTYMNRSGNAVKQAMNVKDVPVENVLVICDDFNLAFGQMRIRSKGSDGGHNGLSSVIERLGSDQFHRLRMGIGMPTKGDVIDYVLEEFKKGEQKDLDEHIDRAVDCCLVWLKEGVNKAMDQYNKKI